MEKKNERKKYESVKSLRLAGYLMMNGFRILRINHDLKVQGRDIYVFEQSEKLSDCIFEYINKRTEEKCYANFNKRSRDKAMG